VRSIETSKEWALHIQAKNLPNVEVLHIDLGPVGGWGRPLGYEKRETFDAYREAGFADGFSPDVVLVGGRFRDACFLSSMLFCKSGTRILFDDYSPRPEYHVVEEIFKPQQQNERQALFFRPQEIDDSEITRLLDHFTHVMD
jgi:hypothetical protein